MKQDSLIKLVLQGLILILLLLLLVLNHQEPLVSWLGVLVVYILVIANIIYEPLDKIIKTHLQTSLRGTVLKGKKLLVRKNLLPSSLFRWDLQKKAYKEIKSQQYNNLNTGYSSKDTGVNTNQSLQCICDQKSGCLLGTG